MCIVRSWWLVTKTSSPWWEGIHSEMPVHMVFSWLHPLLWQWCMLCACWSEISCLRVRESGTVACCQYFCLLIFTLLRLAWPRNLSLQTSASCFICPCFFLLVVFVKTLTIFLTTTEDHSEGPSPKEKTKIDLSVPAQIMCIPESTKTCCLCVAMIFFSSPPCVMVEVARRVLAAALHSNRC